MESTLKKLLMAVVGTILMVILAIIYFVLTLFVIKASADIVLGGGNWDVTWAVLAAALITLGSILSGAVGGNIVNVVMPGQK
ncbi:MAG: hypothetical protein QW520_08610 [Methanomassiliicoccales archaeon]